jgi:hypothetical protein
MVVTQSCLGSRAVCAVCGAVPQAAAADVFDSKHYLTYSVDRKKGKVFRSTTRHVVPPVCLPENDESWSYYRMPMNKDEVALAFAFLERQLNKPMRTGFEWNYILLCRRRGVRLDSDYDAAEAWYCSELAAATLIQFCPHFDYVNVTDPCLVSPCALENSIITITTWEQKCLETDMIRFNSVLPLTGRNGTTGRY